MLMWGWGGVGGVTVCGWRVLLCMTTFIAHDVSQRNSFAYDVVQFLVCLEALQFNTASIIALKYGSDHMFMHSM